MNGLEIANKRIKEKEELTSKIYFWLMLITYIIIKKFEHTYHKKYKMTKYEKQRYLLKAHITAEDIAERILKGERIK